MSTGPVSYDEFGLFHENASEFGLPFLAAPVVRRVTVPANDGRSVSGLVWGETEPEIVFIHGTSMNAHTWDTVALAMGRPAFAVDMPGHGHSSWREDTSYTPDHLAEDLAVAIAAVAPSATLVVGMSLGGMTSVALATRWPELVRKLAVVDITPGTNRTKAKAIMDFVDGPQTFPSIEDLLAYTMKHNPTRSASSLRRGILHNARQLDDGSWSWRWHRRGKAHSEDVSDVAGTVRQDNSAAWDQFAAVSCPFVLIIGGTSPVVDADDIAEFRRRCPAAGVATVPGAGHSIQGDRPLELAAVLEGFLVG